MEDQRLQLLVGAQQLVNHLESHTNLFCSLVSIRYADDASEFIFAQQQVLQLAKQMQTEIQSSEFVNPNRIEHYLAEMEHIIPTHVSLLSDDLNVPQEQAAQFSQVTHHLGAFRSEFGLIYKKIFSTE